MANKKQTMKQAAAARKMEYEKTLAELREYEPFELLNLYIEAKTGVFNAEHILEEEFNVCCDAMSELLRVAKTKEVVVNLIESITGHNI